MKLLLKPLQIIYSIYVMIIFVALMLIIFPFALIASFFGRISGGNAVYRLCMLWGDCWFALSGIFHKNIYETREPVDSQFIYLANHISYLDAAVIVKTLRRPMRTLGKYEMSRIPVFGYIYKSIIILVDRSSAEARAKSVRQLKSVLRKKISIFIFPEGTFNLSRQPLKEFYDGAFRIAIETQTPIRPVLFLDAYNRMHYSSLFSLNPGRSRSVFLAPIPVNGYTLKDVPRLKQEVYDIMERKLLEYGATWVEESQKSKVKS